MTTKTQEKYEKAFRDLINSKNRTQPLKELRENMDFIMKALKEQAEELRTIYALEHNKKLTFELQAQKRKFEEVLNKEIPTSWLHPLFDNDDLKKREFTPKDIQNFMTRLKFNIERALNTQSPNVINSNAGLLDKDKTPSSFCKDDLPPLNREDRGSNNFGCGRLFNKKGRGETACGFFYCDTQCILYCDKCEAQAGEK